MTTTQPAALRVTVDAAGLDVSALLERPTDAWALFVFAHGAGADMHHAFMTDVAHALAGHGVATLRFQFPYTERGKRQVDRPPAAHAAVRAAVRAAADAAPGLALFAGGKSFGARMTSQAQAIEPLPGVRGLVFLGFPLHPAGAPATQRGDHLAAVALPMLFVQGTKDALARLDLIEARVRSLGERATLHALEGADHGFTRSTKARREDALLAFAAPVAAWMRARLATA